MFAKQKALPLCIAILASVTVLYISKNMFVSRAADKKIVTSMVIPAMDFDVSMQAQKYEAMLKHPTLTLIYNSFKEQYNKFHPATTKPEAELRIPNKLHQIWLGNGGNLPEVYKKYQQTWKNFHPDWTYKLWTEKDIATFPFKNKKLFDAAKNNNEKSDIWRYEILEKEGGVYVDPAIECLAPFDVFNHTYDFYTGIQPMDTSLIQLGVGLIGARAGHPLLQLAIVNLRTSTDKKQTMSRTGSIFFTRIFYNAAKNTGLRDIALPASYFYPYGNTQRSAAHEGLISSESFAVYHWEHA